MPTRSGYDYTVASAPSCTQLKIHTLGGPSSTPSITVDHSMTYLQMMRAIQTIVGVEPRHMRLAFQDKHGALLGDDQFRGFRDDCDASWNIELAQTSCRHLFKNESVADVRVVFGHFGGPETHVLRPAFRLHDGTVTPDGMAIWAQIAALES